MIRVFLGFDQREAIAYHTCCQSIIEKASDPVQFIPLAKNMLGDFDSDGSNAFTISRYLVPSLCGWEGWAIFLDGDMTVNVDIAELWGWQNTYSDKAVALVQHDYQTKHPRKYIGSSLESPNVSYPRKNWSSVVLWNCAHPDNRVLDAEYIRSTSPSFLHRFSWLDQSAIGALTMDWNYLVGEQAPSSAFIRHFTLGIPGLRHYADDHGSWEWHAACLRMLECGAEYPETVVKRAYERVGVEKVRAIR